MNIMNILTLKVNMRRILFLFPVFVIIVYFPIKPYCWANTSEPEIMTFLSPGIGIGSSGITTNSLLYLGMQKSNRIFGLSYRYLYSEKCHGNWIWGCGSIDKLLDRSLLFSLGFKKSNSLFLMGFGIGTIDFRKGWAPKYSAYKKKGLGFPLEFRVFTQVKKAFGIGVNFYANLNNIQSYFGAAVNVGIGKF